MDVQGEHLRAGLVQYVPYASTSTSYATPTPAKDYANKGVKDATYSVIAVMKGATPTVIPNSEGLRTTHLVERAHQGIHLLVVLAVLDGLDDVLAGAADAADGQENVVLHEVARQALDLSVAQGTDVAWDS